MGSDVSNLSSKPSHCSHPLLHTSGRLGRPRHLNSTQKKLGKNTIAKRPSCQDLIQLGLLSSKLGNHHAGVIQVLPIFQLLKFHWIHFGAGSFVRPSGIKQLRVLGLDGLKFDGDLLTGLHLKVTK